MDTMRRWMMLCESASAVIGSLTEVRYEDIYPKSFVAFRAKWAAIPREQWADVYVNFSNYNADALQKTAFRDPDHRDPVGVYGYPMEYVIDHPADVWYGQKANFLRVLRSTANNVLNLQQPMTEQQALDLLSKIEMKPRDYYWANYPASPSDFLELALRRFGYRGANRYTKAFFAVAQYKLQYHSKTVPFPGTIQTERLRQMGFDAVLDAGKDEFEAVINSREPEQMLFLTRSAFKVIETVTLRDTDPATQMTYFNTGDYFRKLAALIAHNIGDQLTTQYKDLLHMIFYTRSGRLISLRAEFAKKSRSTIKPHRGADTDTKEDVTVEIKSERGAFKRTYPSTMSYADIATEVGTEFNAMSDQTADFTPHRLTDEPRVTNAAQSWATLAQHYRVPWPATLSEKGAALVAACTDDLNRYLHGPWASSKRFKLEPAIQVLQTFWSKQKQPALLTPMMAIIAKLRNDRKIPVNELDSIGAAARFIG